MPIVHGYNAAVAWSHGAVKDDTLIDISGRGNEFTLNIDAAPADISTFGSAFKGFVMGQREWKATYKGFFDSSGTPFVDRVMGSSMMSGSAGSIVIMPNGSTTGYGKWMGSALVTSFGVTSNTGGPSGITVNFQGNGSVTLGTV